MINRTSSIKPNWDISKNLSEISVVEKIHEKFKMDSDGTIHI